MKLRGLEVPNRIIASPMCQYLSDDGAPNDWHVMHLGRLAIGGCGIVFGEETAVEPEGRKTYACAGLYKPGHIKAWVGGADYKHFQYDNVIQGARQVGSTFKPFVYAAAIDQLRMSPCDRLPDVPYCVSAGRHGNIDAWCPKNSGGKFSG